MQSLARVARAIDGVNQRIGAGVAWLALAMVLVQFVVVLLRYVFGISILVLQESIVYMHATLFMVGAGFTLLHDQHVRVDIFYREAAPRRKAWIDLLGVVAFLWPVCALIAAYGWPYVAKAWAVGEGSVESSGIEGVYLLKTLILVFVALIALQGLSLALKALLRLRGQTPPSPPAEATVRDESGVGATSAGDAGAGAG